MRVKEVNHQVAAHMGPEDTHREEKEKIKKTIRNKTTKVGKLFYKLFTRITGSDTCTCIL